MFWGETVEHVKPAIGVISGFLPKRSPRAQRDVDGQKVDTLYAVFVDCSPDMLQADYTDAKMKEKKVLHIPFADAIKAGKISNYFKFQPSSLPHPATVDFLCGIFEEGYDDSGFLIEVAKVSKTKGKSSQGKVTKSTVKPTSMQKGKNNVKRDVKSKPMGKKKAKKANMSSMRFLMMSHPILESLYIHLHILHLPCLYLYIPRSNP